MATNENPTKQPDPRRIERLIRDSVNHASYVESQYRRRLLNRKAND